MLWLLIPAGTVMLVLAFVLFGRKWAMRYRHTTETLRSFGLTVSARPPLVANGEYRGLHISIGTERRRTTASTVYNVITVRARCLSAQPELLTHRRKSDSIEFQSAMGLRAAATGNAEFDDKFRTLVKDDAGAALWRDGSLAHSLLQIADPDSSTELEDFRISAGEVVLAFSPAWLSASLAKSSIEFIVAIASSPDASIDQTRPVAG